MMTPGDMPAVEVQEIDGEFWFKQLDTDEWLTLGHAPVPRTRWQTFWYHVGHGLIMRYPLPSILRFAWRNRDGFINPTTIEVVA